jgi:hypothetical protein
MASKIATPDKTQVHLRLDTDTARRVISYMRFVNETTGIESSRADAILALTRKGLAAWKIDTLRGVPSF